MSDIKPDLMLNLIRESLESQSVEEQLRWYVVQVDTDPRIDAS